MLTQYVSNTIKQGKLKHVQAPQDKKKRNKGISTYTAALTSERECKIQKIVDN